MKKNYPFLLLFKAFLFFAFAHTVSAQIGINYQNPTALFVCDKDAMQFTITNNTGTAVSNVSAIIQCAPGIEYVPSSVQNAIENNISNLASPSFTLSDLAAGASVTVILDLAANCSLVDKINTGSIFSTSISINTSGGNEQVTTNSFSVETGLVVISGVSPLTLSGEKGDVIDRVITVRNTRLGPINALRLIDQHAPGIMVNVAGSNTTVNTLVYYETVLDASFFTSIGDGDNLFEKDEVLQITERVEITDCGIPSWTNSSNIRIGWGCDGAVCQSDSILANSTILTSTKEPNLVVTKNYSAPVNICASEGAFQELIIENQGNIEAQNALFTLRSADTLAYGIEDFSFEIDTAGSWEPYAVNLSKEQILPDCGKTYSKEVLLAIAKIPAGATVKIRFKTYYCADLCFGGLPDIAVAYYYGKPCPVGGFEVGVLPNDLDSNKYVFGGKMRYDIEQCMYDGQTYPVMHEVVSPRLLEPGHFVHLNFEFPWGMFWESSNDPFLGGIPPTLIEFDTFPGQRIEVHLVFPTPFLSDSVTMEFAITNICQDPSVYPSAGAGIAQSGGIVDVYAIEAACEPCFQKIPNQTIYSTDSVDLVCGYGVCDTAEVILSCGCQDDVLSGGMCWINEFTYSFDSYRTNYGFEDKNDDRLPDNNQTAKPNDVRLDRYIVGDTMRVVFNGLMVSGGDLDNLPLYYFTESMGDDFGLLGGDGFNLQSGVKKLTSTDSIDFLVGTVRIKKSTGEVYECKVGQSNYIDQHYIYINTVNTKPEKRLDSIITMRHDFHINFAELAANTACLPADEVVTVGDSVIIILDFKYRSNFAPYTPPPLVNLRTSFWGRPRLFIWKNILPIQYDISQYSGFVEDLRLGTYSIKPCELSSEVTRFKYDILIARANMFPKEVRPLAKILDYRFKIGPGLTVNTINLRKLDLQQGLNLFQNMPLTYTYQLDFLDVNLEAFFEDPLDEGYTAECSTIFDPSCNFLAPSTGKTSITLDYQGCINMPSVQTKTDSSLLGYYANRPRLIFNITDTIIQIPTRTFDINFNIKNDRPLTAKNAWVHFSSPNGSINGLVLTNNGQTISKIGDIFQLNDITGQQTVNLALSGESTNCRPIDLIIQYGWDCASFTNINEEGCGRDTVRLLLRPLFPELELDILSEPATIPLCVPSDYYSFEIYNANTGFAYDLLASVKLPQGLSIVPNSCQIAYPSNGTFTNVADPLSLVNNIYLWSISDLVAAIGTNGLKGVAQSPQNSFTIRFKVLAECGFVSNAQPVFGTEGITACGSRSNVLRKPGSPLNLEGITAEYGVQASITPENTNENVYCGQESVLNMQLSYQGAPSNGDSIYVLLPQGISYVSGSYQAGQNAPTAQPTLSNNGGQLQWQAPTSIVTGTTVKFSIQVRYDETAGCDDKIITLQARQNTSAFCQSSGQNCAVYVANGEALYNFNAQNPDLQVTDFQVLADANGDLSFSASLDNVGSVPAPSATIQLYLDANENGKVDVGETLIQTIHYGQDINAGASVTISTDLQIPSSDLCKLIGFIPADQNCACDDQSFPIQGLQVRHALQGLCTIQALTLGVPNTAGTSYTWNPGQSLSCTNCNETIFTPDANTMGGDAFTFVLTEQNANCSIDHVFGVFFNAPSGIETPDQMICEGDAVEIVASTGSTYAWTGPGISNQNQQTQTVSPSVTSTYAVTVTTADGCTGSSMVTVTVNNRDTTTLSSLSGCEGQVLTVFGQDVTTSGIYCMGIPTANGCDSMICHTVSISPSLTEEIIPFCAGDSVLLFDVMVAENTSICRDFTTPNGCDSTHCKRSEMQLRPSETDPDTLYAELGETVTLTGPNGYDTYQWLNPESMTQSIEVVAMDSLSEHPLIISNAAGCLDTVIYRILVLPPCDFAKIGIPNAFTPGDGDGINDTFEPLDNERQEKVLSLLIYNRWGQKVYASGTTGIIAWDGTQDGQRSSPDVYIYIMEAGCREEREKLTGDVTLIR